MIVTKRANDPVWTNIYAYAQLPNELRRLDEIAHNLWWVWTPKAQNLFRRISPELWESTEGNPVTLTRLLSPKRRWMPSWRTRTLWLSWTKSTPTSVPI